MSFKGDSRYNNWLFTDGKPSGDFNINKPLPVVCREHGFYIVSSGVSHVSEDDPEGCPVCDKKEWVKSISDGEWAAFLVECEHGHAYVYLCSDQEELDEMGDDLVATEFVKYGFKDNKENVKKFLEGAGSKLANHWDISDLVKVFTGRRKD